MEAGWGPGDPGAGARQGMTGWGQSPSLSGNVFTVAGNILNVVMVYLDFIQNLIKLILRENIDKLAVQNVKDLILLQRSSQDRGNV